MATAAHDSGAKVAGGGCPGAPGTGSPRCSPGGSQIVDPLRRCRRTAVSSSAPNASDWRHQEWGTAMGTPSRHGRRMLGTVASPVFGTYPNALNPPGEPRFVARRDTPTVNGLTEALLRHNPNAAD